MIIDFTLKINNYREKILNNHAFLYKCPRCGAKHTFIRHATYNRYISYLENYKIKDQSITILRLLCKSCKSTHAILPADTVPYKTFTESTIIYILLKHFAENKSVAVIANECNISTQFIYYLISNLKTLIISIFIVLKTLKILLNITDPNPATILNSIVHSEHFSCKYLINTKRAFLMTKFHNKLTVPINIGAYF